MSNAESSKSFDQESKTKRELKFELALKAILRARQVSHARKLATEALK